MERRLYRSTGDRVVAGVCAGLGEYFEIDPTLVRAAFLLLAFVSGIGIVAYVVLALLTPRQSDLDAPVGDRARHGIDDLGDGATHLARRARSAVEDARDGYAGISGAVAARVVLGLIFVAVGSLLLLSNFFDLWLLGWRFVWPLLIVVAGLFILFRSLGGAQR